MAKRKYTYEIEINRVGDSNNTYVYRYGSTENIHLDISKTGIRVTAAINRKYTKDDLLGYGRYYLFPDAIKKGLLLHLLLHSSELEIHQITIRIDGNEEVIDDMVEKRIYSLIQGDLVRPIHAANWGTTAVVQKILGYTKTKQDGRMASLYALLISKTKTYEADRFIYLWMAFNGLYGFVSGEIESVRGLPKKIGDSVGIGYFLAIYGWTKQRVYENDSMHIARKVIRVLDSNDVTNISKESLETGAHTALDAEIQPLLTRKATGEKINVSTYGYLLGFFSYYFRCKIIHANKPIPLYSHESEYEIKCLKIINQMLEDFLDHNLHLYFDDTYITTFLHNNINRVFEDSTIDVR